MATSRTDIISETAIAYMRPMSLAWTITNAKPNTKLYAFFDGVSVDSQITQTGGVMGVNVVTDASGQQTGTFAVTDFTYTTGTKVLKFQDTAEYTSEYIPGSTVSSAEGKFTSSGTLRTTRETLTTINTVVESSVSFNNVIGGLGDPLAQSFFTHGVTGGVNITKIDIFFQSKEADGSIPVTLEVREMVAGYPSPILVSQFSRVIKQPADIIVSADGTVPTSFVFDTPIFLPENRDWCFVLLSNSDKYYLWTAKLGEKSQETGLTIFEQPFIGSMFKSENNVTWATDSTEDIKFTMHKAVFDTAGASVTLRASANKLLIYGSNMSVTSGSNIVHIRFDHLHGLRNSDKLRILAPVGLSTYRGVTAAQLTGLYVTTYVDDYTVNIQLPAGVFTSTGTLAVPGIVNEIQIDSGGTGYNTTPTISIVGTCTTPATATVQTTGGVITGVTITNPGAGYVTKPNLVLTGIGAGAALALISETVLQVETNRVYDEVLPRIANFAPALSKVTSTIKTTSSDYSIQNASVLPLNLGHVMPSRSILVSTDNNTAFLPGQTTTEIVVTMASDTSNVSPIVSISETPTLECRAYVINNQTEYETVTPSITVGSGSVSGISIGTGGTGYTSTGITISAPNLSTGVQAVATAILTSTVVTGINITNAGSGYTSPPTVSMTQTVGTPAVLTPVITAFNTELLPKGGTAKSKYITKPISLSTVSTGVVLYANAYSASHSSFDFYFRSSLRSDSSTHTALPWKMMNCDVSRNKSSKPGEYLDYTFYLNGLNPFDVYDIKIVMRATDRTNIPIIANYRSIILAT
jgi:hypothetical protein